MIDINQKKKSSFYETDILTRTVYGEARGEIKDGKAAVCWVAINRARIALKKNKKQFGDGTLSGACLAPMQFSCWNKNDPNREKILDVDIDDESYVNCLNVVLDCLNNKIKDPTNGCDHYWSLRTKTPYWALGKDFLKIGTHAFIKLEE